MIRDFIYRRYMAAPCGSRSERVWLRLYMRFG